MVMSAIFVGTRVSDYPILLQGLDPDTDIVLLDPESDGVLQMVDWLSGKSGYDALISHGSAGQLNLGSTS